MTPGRWWAIGLFAVVLAVAIAAAMKRRPRTVPTSIDSHPGYTKLRVLRAHDPITIDGEASESGWKNAARTNAFSDDDRRAARPFSEARFAWRDRVLYVELYAADEDIHSDDAFHLTLRAGGIEHSLDVSALGDVTTKWNASIFVAHDVDGTPNHPQDDDEEWVIEMALPLGALGLEGKIGETIDVAIDRCDVFKTGAKGCGAWRGTLLLCDESPNSACEAQ